MHSVILDNLAARIRPAGLCLILLQADGTILYRDPSAPAFFNRYALALMEKSEPNPLRKLLSGLNAGSPITKSSVLPGVVLPLITGPGAEVDPPLLPVVLGLVRPGPISPAPRV